MSEKGDDRFELTELFMAKAGKNGWDRCFHGVIRRERDDDGNPVVYGNIKVNDGFIIACARDQWILGEKLDDMVLMILDFGLHDDTGTTIDICGTPFFIS